MNISSIGPSNMMTTLVAPSADYEPTRDTSELSSTTLKNNYQVEVQTSSNEHMIKLFEDSYYELLARSKNSMLSTYSYTPTGKEHGNYLAIDLGGSTLRVAVISVANCKTQTVAESSWLIKDSEKVMNEVFFNTIASRIKEVLQSQQVISTSELIHCGVTWSFPLTQTAPNNGILENVGKGYQLPLYSKGQDLKKLIEKSCTLYKLEVSVDAIINDSISVVVAGKFLHDSQIGIVLGTGTNSSISVPQALLPAHKRSLIGHDECLMNTELSFFGSHLQPLVNRFDILIDKRWKLNFNEVVTPHMDTSLYGVFQPLELMTGGRYISELVRLELLENCQLGLLGFGATSLPSEYTLDTQCICNIHEKSNFDLFSKLYSVSLTEPDKLVISQIIERVISRAVYVLGLSIVALLRILLKDSKSQGEVRIGFVGSILQHFHRYRHDLEDFVNSEQSHKVKLLYIENSSVNGAAIAAASANLQ